jgi:nitrogen fixation/metabolism regulation signal transduction histidine kinase
MSLRCVIVEDQTMFRQMLHNMLQGTPDLTVAAATGSEAEGIAACERHKPDLLVLDLALPDGSGVNVGRCLARIHPGARIIILSVEAITEAKAKQREITLELAGQGDAVELVIGDSGPGWPAGAPAEVPLTTTKKSGTGIGLYVARTAVENHRGRITFGRSPLGGAEVRLSFPRAEEKA